MIAINRRSAGRRAGLATSLIVVAVLLGDAAIMHAAPAGPATAPYLRAFPDFAQAITPQLPGDIDPQLKLALEAKQQFALVQREFDLYSWQMFLSLNWPTDRQGHLAPALTGTGAPDWTVWHESFKVFRTDGGLPAACPAPGGVMMLKGASDQFLPVSRGLKPFSPPRLLSANAAGNAPATRQLGVISAVGELNAANLGGDIQQAFTGPLIDRNGQFVFYEIMIDPNETQYLCANKLYNINGQIAFSKTGSVVAMPSGVSGQDGSGSFELKLAWRILDAKTDDVARFRTMEAIVWDQGPDGKPLERRVTVGLVGMHIGHKSASSPQWIWSTFEQIDNLDVDAVTHPGLKPSFSNPDCPLCATNILPVPLDPKADNPVYPRIPTQAWRAIPIPGDKVSLNVQAQAVLRQMGSVWQYYQLIDTQWPTQPGTMPSPWNSGLPDSVANKSGGHPTPVMLTNITMETYFQTGNQMACHGQELPKGQTCPVPAVAYHQSNGGKAQALPSVSTTVFMTESCTGCHSSAGIYTGYDPMKHQGTTSGQLSADFSWLMSQKAAWYTAAR